MFGQSIFIRHGVTKICKALGMDDEDAKTVGSAAKWIAAIVTLDAAGVLGDTIIDTVADTAVDTASAAAVDATVDTATDAIADHGSSAIVAHSDNISFGGAAWDSSHYEANMEYETHQAELDKQTGDSYQREGKYDKANEYYRLAEEHLKKAESEKSYMNDARVREGKWRV